MGASNVNSGQGMMGHSPAMSDTNQRVKVPKSTPGIESLLGGPRGPERSEHNAGRMPWPEGQGSNSGGSASFSPQNGGGSTSSKGAPVQGIGQAPLSTKKKITGY